MKEIILPSLLRANFHSLTGRDKKIVEIALFCRVYKTVTEIFKNIYKDYLKLNTNQFEREDEMMDNKFLQFIIKDILVSGDYSLEGIANILRIPLDVIVEIASGINENPSLNLALKILNLHQSVRKNFYSQLIKKIVDDSID